MTTEMLSHHAKDQNINDKIEQIKTRIQNHHETAEAQQRITLLEQLSEFELGQFLIQHGGLNGHWTHEVVTWNSVHPQRSFTNSIEQALFEKIPATLATRERFQIFKRLLQARLKHNQVLLSIPSGYMSELLLLDYSHVSHTRLIGIDLDPNALNGAKLLATQQGKPCPTLIEQDAWQLNLHEEVDILTSNGLNIYEHDDMRVIELYQKIFQALKTGGQFITSFLTPPPSWNMEEINLSALELQKLIFIDILQVKWSAYRTEQQTIAQLKEAGFSQIEIIYDRAAIFPTVVATK